MRLDSRFRIDPENGIVYGVRGKPVGSPDSCGYLQVDCRSHGGGMVSVHISVWESVHGPVPAGLQINHKNGNKRDNRIDNLEAVTHRENILHAYRTGLKSNRGENHPSSKLDNARVIRIRKLITQGHNCCTIGRMLGIHRKAVSDIKIGKTWTHVQEVTPCP